jgi:DNA-binding transcriptional ArsR family regulator
MLNIAGLPATAVVESLEALRAISDSWRHRILTLLIREPLTPSQIAEKLKIARTRVYYHLDLLVQHGFIRIIEERPVAGVVERTYRACAQCFRVDRAMLAATTSEPDVNDAQARLLESAADDLRALPEHPEVLVSRSFLRLSPERALELRSALAELLRRYSESDENGQAFEMTLALFSSAGES